MSTLRANEICMKKTMPKPINWQDFESLCKKLWSEVWDCDNIKKNGRAGQSQHGVDIYGIPNGKTKYYGIQCKGKDDYTKSVLTQSEIDGEINKALSFKPMLSRFIFATTANKDAGIEEYIRLKNQEMVNAGKFSVDLFSWEDVVDLIEENKNTYDWYLKDVLHKANNGFSVTINEKEQNVELKPIFIKKRIIVHRHPELLTETIESIRNMLNVPEVVLHPFQRCLTLTKTINHSFSEFRLCFSNTGGTAIEDYKAFFMINCGAVNFKETNYIGMDSFSSIGHLFPLDYSIEDKKIIYIPRERSIIVPEDRKQINLYVELPQTNIEFDLQYKLLSRSFNSEGKIHVLSKPQFESDLIMREPNEGEEEREYEEITTKEEKLT